MPEYVLVALLIGLVVYQEWMRRTGRKEMKDAQEARITETKDHYEKQIAEMQTQLATAQEQLRKKDEQCLGFAANREEISKVKADCAARVEETKASRDTRIADMKATYEAQLTDLRAKLSESEQRVRDTEKKYEDRIAAAEKEPAVASYSFSLQKETGKFFKKIREVTLMATFQHGKLVFWSGDASYMEDLKIPAFIRKAIEGALAAGQVILGAPPIPRLT